MRLGATQHHKDEELSFTDTMAIENLTASLAPGASNNKQSLFPLPATFKLLHTEHCSLGYPTRPPSPRFLSPTAWPSKGVNFMKLILGSASHAGFVTFPEL